MTGLFAKARLVTLGNLHALLDKAIDLNSIPAVEQALRDLQSAREDLEGTLAENKFDLTTAKTNLAAHLASAQGMEHNITDLANNGKADSAKKLAVTLVTLNRTIEQDKATVASDQAIVAKMEDAVAKVKARETQLNAQLGTLRTTVATSRAQGRATEAIKSVGSAMQAGGLIDGLTERIGRQAARNQAAFDNALGAMDTPADATTDAEADALLAKLTNNKASAA